MSTVPYHFRRLGTHRPPVYAVEAPWDYLGNIEAVQAGRPGQSRSANQYRAFPVTGRGHASARPLRIKARGPATIFASRREAADALLAHGGKADQS